jgi:hypothetical protein
MLNGYFLGRTSKAIWRLPIFLFDGYAMQQMVVGQNWVNSVTFG